MYISHEALQAMHQEVVNDSLRRSELRRLRKERKSLDRLTDARVPSRSPGVRLMSLVRSML